MHFYIQILHNSASVCVTCAEIVQPGQLPPTEVLIIEQLKLWREVEDRFLNFAVRSFDQYNPLQPTTHRAPQGSTHHLHALL